MSKTKRSRYTLEFKLEAVRLAQGGQSIAAVAKVLGIARACYELKLNRAEVLLSMRQTKATKCNPASV